ncbi:putative Dihydrolipoyllysine-residue acetyltransferase component 5 of pyruvate dehydrogenase complex, chloroplastic [Cocos nucifera]|nr:putative Dihydrolipoyllysine-residue acetyltransferase component 5 of pyruvate dehydrogenase complex, chloroplastic [Cocos nucifera]
MDLGQDPQDLHADTELDDDQGKIVFWAKVEGNKLAKTESIIIIESNMDVKTFYDGYLTAIMVEEGVVTAFALFAKTEDEIPIVRSQAASSFATMASDGPATAPPTVETPSLPSPLKITLEVLSSSPPPSFSLVVASSAHPISKGGRRIIVTPYVKKLAKDLKVELGSVVGSGPMEKIVAKDVEATMAVAVQIFMD